MAAKDLNVEEVLPLVELVNALAGHNEFKSILAMARRALLEVEAEQAEALTEALEKEAKDRADAEAKAKKEAESKSKAEADIAEAAAKKASADTGKK